MLRFLYPELFSPMLYPDAGDGDGGGDATDDTTKDGTKDGTDGKDTSDASGDKTGDKDKPTSPLADLNEDQQRALNELISKRVNEAVTKAVKETQTKVRKELEAAAKQKEAEDAGDWQKLAEQRAERITELEGTIKANERLELARTVAKKHGLSDDLVDFLNGEDEATLETQAQKLKKAAGTREAPDTDGGKGGSTTNGTGTQVSDKPITEKKPASEQEVVYTFDGRPKTPWV